MSDGLKRISGTMNLSLFIRTCTSDAYFWAFDEKRISIYMSFGEVLIIEEEHWIIPIAPPLQASHWTPLQSS